MKFGNQGYDLWPKCRHSGVAAMTYSEFANIDLRKHSMSQPAYLWAKLSPSQKSSLRNLAFGMLPGDTIYVKSGALIVGRGIVTGPYRFDSDCKITCPGASEFFAHQVPVDWEHDFIPVEIVLGAEQFTVLSLDAERVLRLEKAIAARIEEEREFVEAGTEEIRMEAVVRNRALRAEAIRLKGHTCEVCDFNFEDVYGELGLGFVEVHHLVPLSVNKRTPRNSTIADVAVVCANCHRMLHRYGAEPISMKELKRIVAMRRAAKPATKTK